MLLIHVRVPKDRDQTALVEIRSGLSSVARGLAAASASGKIAASHGNALCDPMRPWGHPPLGNYRLLAHGPAPKGCDIEYGRQLLVFQPESGRALEAESFGRLTLLAYAGPADSDGRPRRTQGGVRLQQETFDALLARLGSEDEVLLQIERLRPPAWWQFWKRPEASFPLAPDVPRFSEPPLDEASLAQTLAAGKRLVPRSQLQQDDDDFDSRNRDDSDSSSSSSSTRGDSVNSGRGVDAAGRITAAAAGAAVAGAAIPARAEGDSDAASRIDTAARTNY